MDRKFNSNLVENSRELRKNLTKEERHLWYDFLKDYSVRFKRQKIIGKYIVDFYFFIVYNIFAVLNGELVVPCIYNPLYVELTN